MWWALTHPIQLAPLVGVGWQCVTRVKVRAGGPVAANPLFVAITTTTTTTTAATAAAALATVLLQPPILVLSCWALAPIFSGWFRDPASLKPGHHLASLFMSPSLLPPLLLLLFFVLVLVFNGWCRYWYYSYCYWCVSFDNYKLNFLIIIIITIIISLA